MEINLSLMERVQAPNLSPVPTQTPQDELERESGNHPAIG
jgi:hypothetical protein